MYYPDSNKFWVWWTAAICTFCFGYSWTAAIVITLLWFGLIYMMPNHPIFAFILAWVIVALVCLVVAVAAYRHLQSCWPWQKK